MNRSSLATRLADVGRDARIAARSLSRDRTFTATALLTPVDASVLTGPAVTSSEPPEVFFFNDKNVLIYHGAIDNDRSGRNVTEGYLKAAFTELLGGKAVSKTRANAFGCTIKRVGE